MMRIKSLSGLFIWLRRAEKRLDIDGLFIRLNTDGSGSIARFSGLDVFRFDTQQELAEWMQAPRVVRYPNAKAEAAA